MRRGNTGWLPGKGPQSWRGGIIGAEVWVFGARLVLDGTRRFTLGGLPSEPLHGLPRCICWVKLLLIIKQASRTWMQTVADVKVGTLEWNWTHSDYHYTTLLHYTLPPIHIQYNLITHHCPFAPHGTAVKYKRSRTGHRPSRPRPWPAVCRPDGHSQVQSPASHSHSAALCRSHISACVSLGKGIR